MDRGAWWVTVHRVTQSRNNRSISARAHAHPALSQHVQYACPRWLTYTPILKAFVNQFSCSGLLILLFNSYMRFRFLVFWKLHTDSFRGHPTEMPKQTQMPRPIKGHFLRNEPLGLYKHRETPPCLQEWIPGDTRVLFLLILTWFLLYFFFFFFWLVVTSLLPFLILLGFFSDSWSVLLVCPHLTQVISHFHLFICLSVNWEKYF